MDVSSSLGADPFRRLTTVVMPGAIAAAPLLVVVAKKLAAVRAFWADHETAFGVAGFLAIVALGLLLEEIGSRIEVAIDGRLNRKPPVGDHLSQWKAYLQLWVKDEVVAQRYLSGIVMRFKFELSMIPALAIMAIGVGWLSTVDGDWAWPLQFGSLALVLGLAVWFLVEAIASAKLLADTRKIVIDAVRDYPGRLMESISASVRAAREAVAGVEQATQAATSAMEELTRTANTAKAN